MNKFRFYAATGAVLVIAALVFVVYAISNPQLSFPWGNTITYTIYAAYIILTIAMFVLAVKNRRNK